MKTCLFIVLFISTLFSQTLHLALSANPSRLNPLLATDSASGEIAGWLFNGLLKYDKKGEIVGDLAQSWRFISPLELEFTLKKGVQWSDGKPLTADDVVFTYLLTKRPDVLSPYTDEFRFVKNVKAIDPYTVRVSYTQPYFKALEIWMSALLPKHILKNEKDIMTSPFNRKPLGSGPYTLSNFELGKEIELHAHENYFIHKPYIQTINYRFLPDPNAAFMALKAGKIDIAELTPLQYERQLTPEFKQMYRFIERPSRSFTYVGFNLDKKPFNNPLVRHALHLAIDRQEIVDLLFFGHAQVCTGPFMPDTPSFNKDILSPKPDLSQAKILLAKAGFNDKNPLTFELITSISNQSRVYAAQILQRQLARVGVKMTIRVMEWQAFLKTVVDPKRFEAIMLGWSMGLTPDAYSIWHSNSRRKGGFNFVGYVNKDVDKLIEEGEQTINKEKFAHIYRTIFAKIVADNPYLFLYIPNNITAIKKNINPIEPSLLGIMHNQIEWKIE